MMNPILFLVALSVPILFCVSLVFTRATQRVRQPASTEPPSHRLRILCLQGILLFLFMLLLNYVLLVVGNVTG